MERIKNKIVLSFLIIKYRRKGMFLSAVSEAISIWRKWDGYINM